MRSRSFPYRRAAQVFLLAETLLLGVVVAGPTSPGLGPNVLWGFKAVAGLAAAYAIVKLRPAPLRLANGEIVLLPVCASLLFICTSNRTGLWYVGFSVSGTFALMGGPFVDGSLKEEPARSDDTGPSRSPLRYRAILYTIAALGTFTSLIGAIFLSAVYRGGTGLNLWSCVSFGGAICLAAAAWALADTKHRRFFWGDFHYAFLVVLLVEGTALVFSSEPAWWLVTLPLTLLLVLVAPRDTDAPLPSLLQRLFNTETPVRNWEQAVGA